MSYVQASPPERYSVRKVLYSCNSCGKSFYVLQPNGNEIVKYFEPESGEERWLPTFGDGGYLYLIEQLLPSFTQNQEVTMAISRRFEKAFSTIQKPSSLGLPYILFVRASCPECGNAKLMTKKEFLLDSPPLTWMEYHLKEGEPGDR